jgi:hypothetical protein
VEEEEMEEHLVEVEVAEVVVKLQEQEVLEELEEEVKLEYTVGKNKKIKNGNTNTNIYRINNLVST